MLRPKDYRALRALGLLEAVEEFTFTMFEVEGVLHSLQGCAERHGTARSFTLNIKNLSNAVCTMCSSTTGLGAVSRAARIAHHIRATRAAPQGRGHHRLMSLQQCGQHRWLACSRLVFECGIPAVDELRSSTYEEVEANQPAHREAAFGALARRWVTLACAIDEALMGQLAPAGVAHALDVWRHHRLAGATRQRSTAKAAAAASGRSRSRFDAQRAQALVARLEDDVERLLSLESVLVVLGTGDSNPAIEDWQRLVMPFVLRRADDATLALMPAAVERQLRRQLHFDVVDVAQVPDPVVAETAAALWDTTGEYSSLDAALAAAVQL